MPRFNIFNSVRTQPPGNAFIELADGTRTVFQEPDPFLPFLTYQDLEVVADLTNDGVDNPTAIPVIDSGDSFTVAGLTLTATATSGLGTVPSSIHSQTSGTLYVELEYTGGTTELRWQITTEAVGAPFLTTPGPFTTVDLSGVTDLEYTWNQSGETRQVAPATHEAAYTTCAYNSTHLLIFTSFRYIDSFIDGQGTPQSLDLILKYALLVNRTTDAVSVATTDFAPASMPVAIHTDETTFYALGIDGPVATNHNLKIYLVDHTSFPTDLNTSTATEIATLHNSVPGTIRQGTVSASPDGFGTFSDADDIYFYVFNPAGPTVTTAATLALSVGGTSDIQSTSPATDLAGNYYIFFADFDAGNVDEIVSSDLISWGAATNVYTGAEFATRIWTSKNHVIYSEPDSSNWLYRQRNGSSGGEVKFDPLTRTFEFQFPPVSGSKPAYRVIPGSVNTADTLDPIQHDVLTVSDGTEETLSTSAAPPPSSATSLILSTNANIRIKDDGSPATSTEGHLVLANGNWQWILVTNATLGDISIYADGADADVQLAWYS